MDERAKELRRQRKAEALQKSREDQRRAEEADRARGALRARLAAQGVELGAGTAGLLEDDSRRKADQAQADADELWRMEREGYQDSIAAARKGAGMATLGGFLGGMSSFGQGLGALEDGFDSLKNWWGFT